MRAQFRLAAVTLFVVLLLLLCIFMVVGCGSDDAATDFTPPYQKTLCEVLTDSTGCGVTVRFDDGHEAPLRNRIDELTPDSTYRVGATTVEDAQGVTLYNATMIAAPMPAKFHPGETKADPVDVITVWREPRYINLRLAVACGNAETHSMAWADGGTLISTDGKRVKTVTFCHDRHDDPSYYRRETLVSCPVYQLAGELRQGRDSVRVVVNTPEGRRSWSYPY